MARALKRVLTAVVGLVGLAVVAAVVAPFVPVDGYRPRLEAAATRVLGLPVRIEGPMRLGLLPAPHVSVDGGRARKEGGALFASVRRTRLYPKLLPLVVGSFRLRRVDLDRPVLTVERSGSGGTNAIGLEQAAMLLGSLDGVRLEASHGTIVYADSSGRRQVEASGVRLSVRSERVAAAADTAAWRTSALDATIACDSIRAGGAVATGSVLTVHASNGVYDLNAARVHLFGGEAEGTLRADFTRPVPRYQLRASLPGFRVERFLGAVGADSMGAGTMDFAASLSLTGRADSELVRSADGWCSLRGSGLVLRGTDLDGAISHFESSRSFHLVDIGAVLLVGPLGLAVTKGYDYAKLFLGVGDSTAVPEFVSRWRVEHGVAHATDAAFVTPKHRLALQGGLDFAGGRFDDLTVAVVNDKGCAELKQTIHGPFAAPEVDKPDVFSALLGPVEGIARTAKDLLPFTDCTPFYTGSVAPPGSEHGSR